MLLQHVENSSEADLLLWLMSGFGLFIFVSTLMLVAWFVPWVFVLHFGVLMYFPYEPDGAERYVRITGPLSKPFNGEWIGSQNIPKHCKHALVAAEDTRFFEHPGIDIDSIEKNLDANKKRKRTRGGSTITQQLVKNAFLSRERSYVRKAREIVGAVLLNGIMSKDTQLTWYFNVVEFGPRLYGIKAAAQKYFKKAPQNLTLQECISLAAILPNPKKWNTSLVQKSKTAFMARRTRVIESRMRALGFLGRARPVEAPEPELEEFEESGVTFEAPDVLPSDEAVVEEIPPIGGPQEPSMDSTPFSEELSSPSEMDDDGDYSILSPESEQ